VRQFQRGCESPRIHLFAALIIGRGIGASASVFSVIDAVLLPPLH
jgi:hypothetical protein